MVSPQARGGGTGGRAVRAEKAASCRRFHGEWPGAINESGVAAGIMTEGAAGTWQERGGHGQAVAQQSGSVWQQADAHSAAGTGAAAAGASGAAAKLKSSRINAANLIETIYRPLSSSQTAQRRNSQATKASRGARMGRV